MKLKIPFEVWQQMQAYTLLAAPNEITGIGTIYLTDKSFTVGQIFIPQQTVSPIACESTPGAMNEIIFDLIKDNPASAGDLRFRWHSHGNSGVFWSPTDEEDIATWQGPWVVNLVMNAYGEYLIRLDTFQDLPLTNLPLDLEVNAPLSSSVLTSCDLEIRAKVQAVPDFPSSCDKQTKITDTTCYREMMEILKGGEKS